MTRAIIIVVLLALSSMVAAKIEQKKLAHDSDLGIDRSMAAPKSQYKGHVKCLYPKCIGRYCPNDDWSCPLDSSTDCHNVEHIIDSNGPEFRSTPQCKNEIGNQIMTHGQLNQEWGNLVPRDKEGCDQSLSDETRVYRQTRIDMARASIGECIAKMHEKRAEGIDTPYMVPNYTEIEWENGLFIIPQYANVTLYDYNDDALTNCSDLLCDACFFIMYVDGGLSSGAILGIVVASLILVACVGAAGTYGILLFRKRYSDAPRHISDPNPRE